MLRKLLIQVVLCQGVMAILLFIPAVPWQHINLLRAYDFSDEKLRDSVGIRPPKEVKNLGAAEPRYVLQSPRLVENYVRLYVPLLEFNRCYSSPRARLSAVPSSRDFKVVLKALHKEILFNFELAVEAALIDSGSDFQFVKTGVSKSAPPKNRQRLL